MGFAILSRDIGAEPCTGSNVDGRCAPGSNWPRAHAEASATPGPGRRRCPEQVAADDHVEPFRMGHQGGAEESMWNWLVFTSGYSSTPPEHLVPIGHGDADPFDFVTEVTSFFSASAPG